MPAVWYPGAKVRLQVRFEDFSPRPPAPAPPGTPGEGGAEAFGPGLGAQSPSWKSVGMDIIPHSCSVDVNSYRKADEARVTLPLSSLPFDPRILRSVTMQIFGGTFTAAEWAEANGPAGAEGLLIPDTVPEGRAEAFKSNEIFRGFVDLAEMTLSGHDTIDLSARDLTGPLIDQDISTGYLNDLPRGMPLDQLIQLLLTGDGAPTPELSRRFGVPGFRGILVVNESLYDPLPRIADIRPPQWIDSTGKTRRGRKNPPTSGADQSYWDVITDLVVSAGFIVYMRPGVNLIPGTTDIPAAEIVISDPRTYYKESKPGLSPKLDPGTRVFAYGRNVSDMKISRKLGGVVTPSIEVVAHDVDTGETLRGRYPPGKVLNAPATSGVGDRETVKIFELDEISGPGALDQLTIMAQSIHEQLSRGEMTVNFSTKSMAGLPIFADDGIESDMFRLRPGDPIEIQVDPADVQIGLVSAYTLFTRASPAERVEQMKAVGIPQAAAAQAAAALDNPYIQTTFRVQKVGLGWDNKSGWEFNVDSINFLDVRNGTFAV